MPMPQHGALDTQTPAMSRLIRLNSGLCSLHITKNRETNIMNNPKLPYAPFRFIPRQDDIEHFKMLCLFVHPQNPDDLAKRYSYFGAQFGYDLGMVQRNTATIQGTPSISAAGQMALVRMNPNTTYLRETERSDEASTWELKRNDEPDDVIHVIRVTYDMAVQAGWAKGHMWNKIRGAMLSARSGAWVCRIGMPEVCSGMYTIDEMADSVGLQGEELDEAMALSFGTNADLTRSPQPMPQPSTQPRPQPAPQHIEIDQSINSLPVPPMPTGRKHRADDPIAYAPTPSTGFDDLSKIEATYKNIGLQVMDAVNSMANHGLDAQDLSPEDHKTFFYRWAFSEVVRENNALEDEWWQRRTSYSHVFNEIQLEFKILASVDHSDIVRAFVEVNDAFFELCRVAAYIQEGGSLWMLAQQTLKAIIEKKQGMPAVREVYNKVMGY